MKTPDLRSRFHGSIFIELAGDAFLGATMNAELFPVGSVGVRRRWGRRAPRCVRPGEHGDRDRGTPDVTARAQFT